MKFAGIRIPKLIYETSSKYNEKIQVYKLDDKYRLAVNDVVQSISVNTPSVTRRVWGKVVSTVKEEKPYAEEILLLGLGGGTMAHLFRKEMPNSKVTAVEIDSEMIDVAKKYFDLDSLPNLKIINEDVLRVFTDPRQYGIELDFFDVVIVDTYCGSKYPELGSTGSFFSSLNKLAKPEGLILFNRIYVKKFQAETDAFFNLILDFFSDVKKTTVAGRTNSDNMLIYGKAV